MSSEPFTTRPVGVEPIASLTEPTVGAETNGTGGVDSQSRPGPRRPAGISTRVRGLLHLEFCRFAVRMRLLNAALFFCPHFALNALRTNLYRAAGIRIGRNSLVFGSMELSGDGQYWKRLTIGNECQITGPLYVDLNDAVTIGHRVAVGHHAKLVTTSHDYSDPARRCGTGRCAPIVIEDGAWIGAAAVVLAGVTVGKGSVVAAGAVVTRDVAPDTLAAGVPARAIRKLPGGEPDTSAESRES